MLPVKRNHVGFKTVIVMYYFAQGGQRSVTVCALNRAGRKPPVWVLIQEHCLVAVPRPANYSEYFS